MNKFVLTTLALIAMGVSLNTGAASAGPLQSARGFAYRVAPKVLTIRPGSPGLGFVFSQGVQGYAKSGWELGRLLTPPQYDPGPYPGFGPAVLGGFRR